MEYKISVIIPVYNGEKDLDKSMSSLINQTFGFENIEVIIVDDNSKDNSKNIIKRYIEGYSNVKGIFLSKNSGLPGKPRNIGIKEASSKYIVFLDSDDCYLENAFEVLYNAIEKENSDFVIATHYINSDSYKFKVNLYQTNEDLINFNPLSSQEVFDSLSLNHFVAPWGKIFNKELILNNKIEFPQDCLCEDTYFYFKSLINAEKVTLLPNTPVYIYNTFEDKKTAIHGHNIKKFNQFLDGMYKEVNLLDNINLSANVTIAENISSLLLIFSNLNKKDKKEAVKKIYDFEKSLDKKIILDKKEINILNNCILKKKFNLAIFISNCYSGLYNNYLIKEFYRKLNNNRHS